MSRLFLKLNFFIVGFRLSLFVEVTTVFNLIFDCLNVILFFCYESGVLFLFCLFMFMVICFLVVSFMLLVRVLYVEFVMEYLSNFIWLYVKVLVLLDSIVLICFNFLFKFDVRVFVGVLVFLSYMWMFRFMNSVWSIFMILIEMYSDIGIK